MRKRENNLIKVCFALLCCLFLGNELKAQNLPPCNLVAPTGFMNYQWFNKTQGNWAEIPNETSVNYTTTENGVYCATFDLGNGMRDTSDLFVVLCDAGADRFTTLNLDVSHKFGNLATYQWFKEDANGTPQAIAGETNPELTIFQDSGVFTVEIFDGLCATTAGPFRVCLTSCAIQEICDNGLDDDNDGDTDCFDSECLPAVFDITGGGTYCSGDANGVAIGLSGSQTGVSYELLLNGGTIVNSLNGTGTALNFGIVSMEGNYTIRAISPENCEIAMNGSVDVTRNESPVVSVNGTNVICDEDVSTLTSNASAGEGTITNYQWFQDGQPLVGENGTTLDVTVDGFYQLQVDNSVGCATRTDSFKVTVLPLAVAVNDFYTTAEEIVLIVNDNEGVLQNDSGQAPLEVLGPFSITTSAGGNVAISSDGSFTYDPPTNFNGLDTFFYRMQSVHKCNVDTGFVFIDVDSENDAPFVVDDNGNETDTVFASTNRDDTVQICFNFRDFEGDEVTTSGLDQSDLPDNGNVDGVSLFDNDSCIIYIPDPTFEGKDTFNIVYRDNGTPNMFDTVTVIVSVIGDLACVQPKVFLEGTYDTIADQMTTHLTREQSLDGCRDIFPLTQPYNRAPWNYMGTESITESELSTDYTDWILVEFRRGINKSTLFQQQAMILDKNGEAFAVNGDGFVCFQLREGVDSIYTVIRHRNHLPIMSADPLTENNGGNVIDIDFRFQPSYTRNSSSGQKIVDNGFNNVMQEVHTMFAGNADNTQLDDSQDDINGFDISVVAQFFTLSGEYYDADLNLDCDVNPIDISIYSPNFNRSTPIDN